MLYSNVTLHCSGIPGVSTGSSVTVNENCTKLELNNPPRITILVPPISGPYVGLTLSIYGVCKTEC